MTGLEIRVYVAVVASVLLNLLFIRANKTQFSFEHKTYSVNGVLQQDVNGMTVVMPIYKEINYK